MGDLLPHAFISYVHEDANIVGHVVAILRANGVDVWLDRDNINPGVRWKDAIKAAIREGQFFVPFFSTNWQARERTVANEELTLAADELRLRPRDRAWFIPLRLDNCSLPDTPISAAESIGDIQAIDLTRLGWEDSLRRLLVALGIQKPVLHSGEPLAPGLPAAIAFTGGELVYEKTVPVISGLQGAVVPVSCGWCERPEGAGIVAYIETRAPNRDWQLLNEQAKLDCFFARCLDPSISTDAAKPSQFHFRQEIVMPAGSEGLNPATSERVRLPVDIAVASEFLAK